MPIKVFRSYFIYYEELVHHSRWEEGFFPEGHLPRGHLECAIFLSFHNTESLVPLGAGFDSHTCCLQFRDCNTRKQLVKWTFRYGITRGSRINLCPDDFRLSLVNQVKVCEKFRCRFLTSGWCWYRLTRESFFVLFRFYEVGFPSLKLTSATSPASASPMMPQLLHLFLKTGQCCCLGSLWLPLHQ